MKCGGGTVHDNKAISLSLSLSGGTRAIPLLFLANAQPRTNSLRFLPLSSPSLLFFVDVSPVTAALLSPLAPALDPLPSFSLQPIENSRHTRNRFLFRSLAGGNVTHPPRFHSLFDLCSALSSGFFRFFFLLVLLFPDHALVNIHTNETFSLSRLAPSKREKSLSRSLG